jgi:hypothetical protein
MGEVIYIEGNPDQHLVCVDPEWLCHKILGALYSHERFFSSKATSGLFTIDDLNEIFSDVCSNVGQLKDILIALDLCSEYDNNGDVEYEFTSLNFSDKKDTSWDKFKSYNESFVYNGFHMKCSNTVKRLVATMFPRIQVNLRNLSNYSDEYTNNHQSTQVNGANSTQESHLINNFMNMYPTNGNNNSVSNVTNPGSVNPIEYGNSYLSLTPSNLKANTAIEQVTTLTNKYSNTLYDIELIQWRFGSKLTRYNSNLECLLTVDPDGEFIELKARAPSSKKEELFYFVQDINNLVQQVILDSCPGLNIEIHYLSQNILTRSSNTNSTITYSPKALYQMQLENKNFLTTSNNDKEKFIDVVCCGSEQVSKNIVLGIDLPLNTGLCLYTRRILSKLLDDIDPMGRDWCLLAVILGLQDYLPKLDNLLLNISKTNYLLDEWTREKQNTTIRTLIEKLSELGRKDVCDLVMNTSILFKVNMSEDSGIRNSNQTLSSSK